MNVMVKKLKNTKFAIDHFWRQQFKLAKNPRIWLSKAYDLKYAELSKQCFLLWGFAFENILKEF